MATKEKTNSYRKTGRIVGIFFITATLAGILGLVFSGPLQAPDYLLDVSESQLLPAKAGSLERRVKLA